MRSWPSELSRRTADIDPDRISEVAPGTGLVVDRLALWNQPAHIDQFESPERWALDIAELRGKVRAHGQIYERNAVLLVVKEGASATLCSTRLDDNCIFILPPGESLHVNFTEAFVWSSAVLEPSDWAHIQEFATGTSTELAKTAMRPIHLTPATALGLQHKLASVTASLANAEARMPELNASDAFTDFVAAIADACVAADDVPKVVNRVQHARRAQDYIRANIKRPISVRRLCEHVGVSRRQIEYAFHDVLGVGPREFTHAVRLNEVRRRLLQARGHGVSVTDVAFEFGINHLSRFSDSYRRLFGESPRETLSLNRRRGAEGAPAVRKADSG